jgi:acetyl esterase
MAALLAMIERAGRPPLHAFSPQRAREVYAGSAEVLDLPRAPLARVENLDLPAADGQRLPARLYAPSGERLPVCLYLHGGGFVVGGLETHDSLCRQISLRSGVAVLALDYRLAPEHRFPTAVEDAWAAMDWLVKGGASTLGLDGERLAVAGDSAGGTLAATCALVATSRHWPLRLQVLITPGTSAWQDTRSHAQYAHGHLLDAATVTWFFGQYIDTAARADWRFAPLMAPDVDDLCSACLVLAECDPLLDEGMAYGDRLRMAGVPVELELARGVTHDFIKMGRSLPEAGLAQAAIGAALRAALL